MGELRKANEKEEKRKENNSNRTIQRKKLKEVQKTRN